MTPHYLTHTHLGPPPDDIVDCTRCGNRVPSGSLWLPNYTCDACDHEERLEQIKAERAADLLRTISNCCNFTLDEKAQADFDRRDRDGSRCNG